MQFGDSPDHSPEGPNDNHASITFGDKDIDEVLKNWEHRPTARNAAWQPVLRDNACQRCGHRVYPLEKIDVGVLYHRSCFKCKVCDRQLTLKTFQRELCPQSDHKHKEIYCAKHVPQPLTGKHGLGRDAMSIKAAVDAQKHVNNKAKGITAVYGEANYGPDASPFEHARNLRRQRGDGWSHKGQHHNYPVVYNDDLATQYQQATDSLEQLVLPEDESIAIDEGSKRGTYYENYPHNAPESYTYDDSGSTQEPRDGEHYYNYPQSHGTERGEEMYYHNQDTLELKGRRTAESTGNNAAKQKALPPEPTDDNDDMQTYGQTHGTTHGQTADINRSLLTTEDFERHGVFEAQTSLENYHRQEEDILYQQILDERRDIIAKLDEVLMNERCMAREQLNDVCKKKHLSEQQKLVHMQKLEEYYDRKREEQLRLLLRRLILEERSAVGRMVDRQSSEMMELIQVKDKEATIQRQQKNKTHDNKSTNTSLLATTDHNTSSYGAAAAAASTAGAGTGGSSLVFQPVDTSSLRNSDPSLATEATTQTDSISRKHRTKKAGLKITIEQPGTYVGHHGKTKPHPVAAEVTRRDDSQHSPQLPSPGTMSKPPQAKPPKHSKATLYKSAKVFSDTDRRAIQEADKDYNSFTDLVRRLTLNLTTDLQKVRAIYRWLTVKNLNKLKTRGEKGGRELRHSDNVMDLLRGIKTGQETYHSLFKRLCSYVGIHCEVIDGYSKGAGYKPGMKFDDDTFCNQWTAVYVEDAWRFINCNWGARHVKGPRDNNLTYKCDEFYFLTDPADHIYQHFPRDPQWQLLHDPITMQDFINLPLIKSPFFNCGLKFVHPYEGVQLAPDGMLEIILQQPRLLPFAAKLKAKSKSVPSDILKERTFVRTLDNEVIVTINLPCTGVYYLELFVAHSWHSEVMDNACCFQVRCSGTSKDASLCYPQIGSFGRTPHTDDMGVLEESHKDPYVKCKGEKIIKFSLGRDIKLSHTFSRWDHRERKNVDMDRYVFMRVRRESYAEFLVRCARKGLYVFTVFATENKDDICVFRYLIDCRTPYYDAYQMPKYSKRWHNAKVHEPMSYCLARSHDVVFRLEVKHAVEVVIQIGDKWFNLHKDSSTPLWSGKVYTGNQRAKLVLYAGYDSNPDKYVPLLEYKVVE